MSKTNDLKNHLPLIFNKEVDTPPRSTSNSLLAKHEAKVATKQCFTPKVQGIRMHQPLVLMANYWGTLTLSYPCDFFLKKIIFLL